MSDLTKTLIKCFICFIMIIAVIFAYGLTIGGYPGIVFYIIMGTIYFIALLIIKGKELFKKEYILPIILIVGIGMLVNSFLYSSFNRVFDNSEPVNSYYSVVDDYPGNDIIENTVWFKDPNGKTKEYTIYRYATISVHFEDGEKIFVEEYEGLFNIEHYKITEIR